jgi:hypothetical protein
MEESGPIDGGNKELIIGSVRMGAPLTCRRLKDYPEDRVCQNSPILRWL